MAWRVVPFHSADAPSSVVVLLDDTAATAPGVYSVDKLLLLHQYTTSTSPWRVAIVMVAVPLCGLVAALLPAFVPLQDPLTGIHHNLIGFLSFAWVVCVVVFVGVMMQWRACAEIPRHVYTPLQGVQVGVIAATLQASTSVVLAIVWRFPTPMSWVVTSAMTGTSVAVGHIAVFRSRMWHDRELRDGIMRFAPAYSLQAVQILLYPTFSVLFDHVSSLGQVLLTIAFPLVKWVMKKALRRHTKELRNFNTEVAVSGIEICASMYQAIIMQSAPSQVAMAVIMGVDVIHGLVMVKLFLDRKSSVPKHLIISEALREIQSHISQRTTSQQTSPSPVPERVETQQATKVRPTSPLPKLAVGGGGEQIKSSAEEKRRIVLQALQLVDKAESILLVEYIEVVIPLINMLFIAIACQLPSTQYNLRLRSLYFHPDQLHHAVWSILVYSGLQAVSFAAMHCVMKYRYGMSATYHLAFIIEYHGVSLLGKMMGWLTVILYFHVVHTGVDFSFRFDYAKLIHDTDSRGL